MTQLEKVLYTATTHTAGARDGPSCSDNYLDVKVSSAGILGTGTDPEVHHLSTSVEF